MRLNGQGPVCGQVVKQQKRWCKFFDPGRSCDYSAYGSGHPLSNKPQATGPFLALDGPSTHTNLSNSGRKYCKLAIFIRNEGLFVVSAVATSAFQLEHTPQLLCSICPAGYEVRTIEYVKILFIKAS